MLRKLLRIAALVVLASLAVGCIPMLPDDLFSTPTLTSTSTPGTAVAVSKTPTATSTRIVLATVTETETPLPTLTPRATGSPILEPPTPTFWTLVPLPTATPRPTSTNTRFPTNSGGGGGGSIPVVTATGTTTVCNWAAFIQHVTVNDGSDFWPSTPFTKTWRLTNIGTCTWTTSYTLVFHSGNAMGGPNSMPLPRSVAPGQSIDLSVNLVSPAAAGTYRGYWMLANASGTRFGTGTNANSPFWVEIDVITSTNTTYDLAANNCTATWTSAAGTLPCPGNVGDTRGYVIKIDPPHMENGIWDNEPALITFPQKVTDGYISGRYPDYSVQDGDRFRTVIGCQYGASACDVIFRLDYQIAGNTSVLTFASWTEVYDGQYHIIDLDLSSLAGQTVNFILTVLSHGSPNQDEAMWLSPHVYHLPPTPTPTATATGTETETPTTVP